MRVHPRLAQLARRDENPHPAFAATSYTLTGGGIVVTHTIG